MSKNRCLIAACVSLGAFLTSGCLGLQAKAVTAPQTLDMPEPPARVVEVRDPEVLPPVPLPEEPVRNAPPRVRPPTPAAATPRPAEPPRAETATDAAKSADDARRATTLQTTSAQQEGEVERRIRALLTQATNDLNRINYRGLNEDARTQYDTAKRFISQSDEALRSKNLLFAGNLADKAAALAAQLAGR